MNKQTEAIHKALKVLNCLNNDRVYETAWVKGAINACEEALEQPAQDYVFICKRCGDDLGIEYVPDEQPAQEPVATIQQFERKWIDKEALEQPAEPRLVSYALDGSTCTLNIDGEEVYFNREQPEGKEFFERGKKIARWADKTEQEPVGVVSWHEGAVMGSIFPSSNMPKNGDKLYTHPHQWQGLTDDEIVEIYGHSLSFIIESGLMHEARNIEQVLKEKNCG